jgi:hypothetical protein
VEVGDDQVEGFARRAVKSHLAGRGDVHRVPWPKLWISK